MDIKKLSLDLNSIEKLKNLTDMDWLRFSEQTLLEITSGEIFHSGLGEIERAREQLKFYPDHILKFCLLGEWNGIAEEFVFMARTADRGDELSSRQIASFLIKRLMRICYLLNGRHISYSKWFGTGFYFHRLAGGRRSGFGIAC